MVVALLEAVMTLGSEPMQWSRREDGDVFVAAHADGKVSILRLLC